MEQPQTSPSPQPQEEKKPNLIAIFSYLGILVLVPLLVEKKDEFVRYHVKQGLVLFLAEIVTPFVAWIPILGWIAGAILWIFWIVFTILGIVNVVSGKKKPLPLIGQFAEKFNI